jgi:hypothetical protein
MMNRYCTRHGSRGNSRAYRMVLARHCYDRDALQQAIDEAGDCSQCLRDVALAAVDAAHALLLRYGPLPGMDDYGNVTGPSVDLLLGRIDAALRCEELDRRDLGR